MLLNPLLQKDFYKACHPAQYPKDVAQLVSYFTPRMSRLPHDRKLVMFGLQAFIKDYLIDQMNEGFFRRPKQEVLAEYTRVLDNSLGASAHDADKIAALHDLGYLPLEIRAIPEGYRVNMRVPMFEITNTHPGFAWLVNTFETALSCYLWHAMISANVGYRYRQIVNEFYGRTVDDPSARARALGDFSMRGQESAESAAKSSAAFCLSFLNTATIPAIPWLEKFYLCDCATEPVAYGAISTEHSVMCSNCAVDGDEMTFLRRLLTEIYPEQNFSVVCDSYNYWNVVDNILPRLKKEILRHKGCMLVRGDSGDPVRIVTDTVFRLWEIFGGTVNQKGFKVLDPHVKAIYGDSITPDRCRKIYEILEQNGFACSNVVLGVGSFSMQCDEGFDNHGVAHYYPYTRDTFGIAVKSTYAQMKDGAYHAIYKNPSTDTAAFKKSQRGCCLVHFDGENFTYEDGLTYDEALADPDNMLKPVFRNGEMVHEYTLAEIRNRLHEGDF